MSEAEQTVKASEVRAGDRIRARGLELTVSRVEDTFLGRDEMVAFVEDSDERWLKLPALRDAEIERIG
ncbi:MAG TPA: hypothetical protein VGF95_13295 [Solirubrobacteraceae bacterium]|jgi:hypothetical protein